MKNTLRRYRECISEKNLYRDIIDAALEEAWCNHVQVFKLHGSPAGNEDQWKDALLAKWVKLAQAET